MARTRKLTAFNVANDSKISVFTIALLMTHPVVGLEVHIQTLAEGGRHVALGHQTGQAGQQAPREVAVGQAVQVCILGKILKNYKIKKNIEILGNILNRSLKFNKEIWKKKGDVNHGQVYKLNHGHRSESNIKSKNSLFKLNPSAHIMVS